jgi:hypothetical protein
MMPLGLRGNAGKWRTKMPFVEEILSWMDECFGDSVRDLSG